RCGWPPRWRTARWRRARAASPRASRPASTRRRAAPGADRSRQEVLGAEKRANRREEPRVFLARVDVPAGDLDELFGFGCRVVQPACLRDRNDLVGWAMQEEHGGSDLVDAVDRFERIADQEPDWKVRIAMLADSKDRCRRAFENDRGFIDVRGQVHGDR